MMAPEDLVAGDPVWAKMKGYPPWPAKIVDPPSIPKSFKNKKASYVLFFGTGDYAWIMNENITPHSESMLSESRSRKKLTAKYKNGIDAIVSYSKTYKKEKQPATTKTIKKEIPENNEMPILIKEEIIENNGTKSPQVDDVKILSSLKKYDRKALKKSLPVKTETDKKKHFSDFNGKNSLPKLPKIENPSSPTRFSPIRDLYDPYSTYQQNKPPLNNINYVEPSNKKIGFLGLGTMGKQIVKCLIQSGHNVSVWNRTQSRCDVFVDMGAKKVRCPADLILTCDITFCCLSDADAIKAITFAENGILSGLQQARKLGMSRKGFAVMTSIDEFTSKKLAEAVTREKGVYIEAPLCGTSKDAEEGTLMILVSGDMKLFQDCESCFHAIAKNVYFVSETIGEAVKMHLIMSTVTGTACAALAEAMVMIEKLKLQKSDFVEYLKHGPLASKFIMDKVQKMNTLSFQKETALKYVQQDLSLTVAVGNTYSQPMPLAATANEIYKLGKLRNYSNEDMSAVYKVVKY